MNMHDRCPKCESSLIGAPIPKDSQEFYGGSTHYRREITVYDWDRDMTIRYKCPDCWAQWDRFTGELLEKREKRNG